MRGMFIEKISPISYLGTKKFVSFNIFTFLPFVADRPTYKIFIENMLIYERNVHRKKSVFYFNQGRRKKISFLIFYISVFCILTDTPTGKMITEQMLICNLKLHTKNLDLYLNQRLTKSRFPLNLTDGRTDGRA